MTREDGGINTIDACHPGRIMAKSEQVIPQSVRHQGKVSRMVRYKKIVVLDNQVEAKLMEATLNERGIPHVIRSYYDSAYDGLYQAQKGWGHVEAPEEYEDEIKAIRSDIAVQGGGEATEK